MDTKWGKIKVGMFCKLGTHVELCLSGHNCSSVYNRHGHPLRVLLRHAGGAAPFFLLFFYWL
jgi:hypothetical protein